MTIKRAYLAIPNLNKLQLSREYLSTTLLKSIKFLTCCYLSNYFNVSSITPFERREAPLKWREMVKIAKQFLPFPTFAELTLLY